MSEATIRLHVAPLEEGGYLGTSPDVPGLVAQGRSIIEVVEIAQHVARVILESCLAYGDPVPPALATGVPPSTAVDLVVPVAIA